MFNVIIKMRINQSPNEFIRYVNSYIPRNGWLYEISFLVSSMTTYQLYHNKNKIRIKERSKRTFGKLIMTKHIRLCSLFIIKMGINFGPSKSICLREVRHSKEALILKNCFAQTGPSFSIHRIDVWNALIFLPSRARENNCIFFFREFR